MKGAFFKQDFDTSLARFFLPQACFYSDKNSRPLAFAGKGVCFPFFSFAK